MCYNFKSAQLYARFDDEEDAVPNLDFDTIGPNVIPAPNAGIPVSPSSLGNEFNYYLPNQGGANSRDLVVPSYLNPAGGGAPSTWGSTSTSFGAAGFYHHSKNKFATTTSTSSAAEHSDGSSSAQHYAGGGVSVSKKKKAAPRHSYMLSSRFRADRQYAYLSEVPLQQQELVTGGATNQQDYNHYNYYGTIISQT